MIRNVDAKAQTPAWMVQRLERAGLRSLKDGQPVTFDIEAGRDGRESAMNLALA